MKILKRTRFTALLLPLLLIVMLVIPVSAAQATVNLGTTSHYAILAGSTITNTGTTIINGDAGGDVGLHPGTAFTGQGSATISGTLQIANAAALQAKNDLTAAYNDAAGRTPAQTIPSELGGTTLIPGVYTSTDGKFQITGTLTLDAKGDPEGVFIFKTASTLITAVNSNINLVGSARYCRTFWVVGSSATLGTSSHFVGHIMAAVSITLDANATVQGQIMAQTGAVTLSGNTITNGLCAVAVVGASSVSSSSSMVASSLTSSSLTSSNMTSSVASSTSSTSSLITNPNTGGNNLDTLVLVLLFGLSTFATVYVFKKRETNK